MHYCSCYSQPHLSKINPEYLWLFMSYVVIAFWIVYSYKMRKFYSLTVIEKRDSLIYHYWTLAWYWESVNVSAVKASSLTVIGFIFAGERVKLVDRSHKTEKWYPVSIVIINLLWGSDKLLKFQNQWLVSW